MHIFKKLSDHPVDETQKSVQGYFDYLVKGKDGKAFCPFIKMVLTQDIFFYARSEKDITKDVLAEDIKHLYAALHMLSSNPYSVVGISYPTSSRNLSSEIAQEIEAWRQNIRLDYIQAGYTIAFTHPQNKAGSHSTAHEIDFAQEPLWITETPLLMLRRLHKRDRPFMKDIAAISFENACISPHFQNLALSLEQRKSLFECLKKCGVKDEHIIRVSEIGELIIVNTETESISLKKEISSVVFNSAFPYGSIGF